MESVMIYTDASNTSLGAIVVVVPPQVFRIQVQMLMFSDDILILFRVVEYN